MHVARISMTFKPQLSIELSIEPQLSSIEGLKIVLPKHIPAQLICAPRTNMHSHVVVQCVVVV